jgi:hypothetical protein
MGFSREPERGLEPLTCRLQGVRFLKLKALENGVFYASPESSRMLSRIVPSGSGPSNTLAASSS